MAATTMVLYQIFYLIDCRFLDLPIHHVQFFSNPSVYVGIATVLLAQATLVYFPFMNKWIHTARFDGGAWGFSFVVASSILITIGVEKWIRYKYFKNPNVS